MELNFSYYMDAYMYIYINKKINKYIYMSIDGCMLI